LAEKVSYVIDPANPYPQAFTGHLRATLRDGSVHEVRQGGRRGGTADPLPPAEILAKFRDNVAHGGWSADQGERLRAVLAGLFEAKSLDALRGFRA
jgi:hypothetical protein